MKEFLKIAKALSNDKRVRIVNALRVKELCVCQIIALFDISPSAISKHLSLLSQANLVESRKEGKWIYYSLSSEDDSGLVKKALKWIEDSLGKNSLIEQDRKKLKEILKKPLEDLCCQ